MTLTFKQKLQKRWEKQLFLCVGLDSGFPQLPAFLQKLPPQQAMFQFNQAIIEATAPYVCAFKPNLAFYEASGVPGLQALKDTCDYLRENHPDIPIILDAKRGDNANSNEGYVTALFDYFGGDAVTVQPYLGSEALAPFLKRKDKGVIVLCRTSNPGARELQDLTMTGNNGEIEGEMLFQKVAKLAATEWNYNDNVSLVVGATYPQELAIVRAIAPDLPLLIPGIGAQGGEIEAVLRNGLDKNKVGVIISSSRAIIFASKGADFAEAAHTAARQVAQEMAELLLTI